MGSFRDSELAQAKGSAKPRTFREADKPDPRASAEYKREKAKAKERDRLRGGADYPGKPKKMSVLQALTEAAGEPLPIGDEIRGGIFAAGNEVANLGRRALGQPTVDSRAIYLANKDAENEFRGRRNRERPVASVVGSVAGGMAATPAAAAAPARAVTAAPSAAGKAARWAANTAKAGGAGGMFGALQGVADGEGVADRLERGVAGIAPGVALGVGSKLAIDTVIAPAVKHAPALISDLVDLATRRPPPPGGRPTASPRQLEQAAQAVERLASQQGLTPQAVAQRADDMFMGKPATAAEILGREGVTQLGATARRGGSTADDLEAMLRLRARNAPERILDDFADDLGVSPAAARGDVERIVEEGRARAKPLYDAALGDQSPVWNDELQGLAQRPAVQRAARLASESARNAGRNPEALGLARIEAPDAFTSASPPDATARIAQTARTRGPATAPARGKSLAKFIADGGGLRDTGGDLAAMDARSWHKGRAYQRPLIGEGAPADDWALRAWEAGYFPEFQTRPTERQLLDALGEELRGRPRFARQADPDAAQRYLAREAADEAVYRGGYDDVPSPDDYVGRPEPVDEMAFQAEPTGQTWDQIKKMVDSLVERDPITRRPVMTGEVGVRNRDLAAVSSDLRRALAGDESRPGAIPGYREALEASGDYLQVDSAFNRAKGRLTRGTVREFGQLWGSLKTPAERDAARAALASDIFEMAQSGQLRGGKFGVPGIQQKLELAYGRLGAQRFVAKMEAEAALARTGQRMMPGNGSPTFELGEAAGDQSVAADIARAVVNAPRNPLGAAMDAVGSGVRRALAYARTHGMPIEVRDEYGRLLMMGADEFEDFLRTRQVVPRQGPDGAWLLPGVVGGELSQLNQPNTTP